MGHENNITADHTPIPTKWVGPISITGNVLNEHVSVPLATYESPLWPSVNRGARVSRHCGGIQTTIVDDRMSRSISLRANDAASAASIWSDLAQREKEIFAVIDTTSRFAEFINLNRQIVGNILYIRVECTTGDASGHNMVTKAADTLLTWILEQYPELEYSSISANYCTDKKVSAVNGILGRGKYVIAEMILPEKICYKMLRTTADKVVRLNTEKNLIGSVLAGSIRTANAHFANMLLAFYLATGQDAANIIEGSQGIVHCENRDGDLYFSTSLPNLIIGSIGSGKSGEIIEGNLAKLGCLEDRDTGRNAQRLAAICAATVLCGELSLMAAQTNPGELMRSHEVIERS